MPPQPQRGPSSSTGHVAELAGEAVRAVQDLAAGDDRAADAGRDGQVDEVVAAARRAEGRSPSAATFVSRSRNAGRSSASRELRGERDVPELRAEVGRLDDDAGRTGSTGPGDEMPMPAMLAATSAGVAAGARVAARRRTRRRRPRDPRRLGVGRSLRASRVPSGWMTAARIRVPPRSTAMTGREDRAKPLVSIVGRARILAVGRFWTAAAPDPAHIARQCRSARKTKTPAGRPAGVRWCSMRSG